MFGDHHVSVVAWPNVRFTESVRVRDGAAAGLPGAKVFEARRRRQRDGAHWTDLPTHPALAEKFCDP
ncbi:hypothetical protein A9320_26765 [Ruegeria sp. PBVC088]|nr:hypothetical protein A9320_26765 [Ruegeria sp. PBVC088]